MNFSPHTETVLRQAGWYPERRIAVTHYLHVLHAQGYTVFPAVQSFLCQFGGLVLSYAVDYHGQALHNELHFDAATAAQAVWNEGYVSRYAEQIGHAVCVIGEADNRSTTLIMDAHGRVYGGFDAFLSYYGATAVEAIEQMIERKQQMDLPH